MRRWLLPESVEDLLPDEARRVEALRRQLLDAFAVHGYQLVVPPLIEYLESLLTGSGHDLDLRTFKLVDQASGRALGLRADITPQVARIDAHLLNRVGVARLCYCGSVLHAVPADAMASRQPLQIGAELYGHAGVEADTEVIRLLAAALHLAAIPATRIDLGHVGIFRALALRADLSGDAGEEVFAALQAKDVSSLRELLAAVPDPVRSAFLALPELYGDRRVIAAAARALPDDEAITAALATLARLADDLADLPVGFDLADLRGYHYHSGVVFAGYGTGAASALALGGRYDQVGATFGRGRPATGFSMDLRQLARLAPGAATHGAILAPWPDNAGLHTEIERLRGLGEIVIAELPGHEGHWREAGCDRRLRQDHGKWIIEQLQEE
jgi:ATP phosphoribosyltransferase regulatory subunit